MPKQQNKNCLSHWHFFSITAYLTIFSAAKLLLTCTFLLRKNWWWLDNVLLQSSIQIIFILFQNQIMDQKRVVSETLILLKSLVASPYNWTDIISVMKENVHFLSKRAKDIYWTAQSKHLKKGANLNLQDWCRWMKQTVFAAKVTFVYLKL